ncbi:MAG: hypothetical protein WA865_13710 [Spirulinaceae cyanobacterium]
MSVSFQTLVKVYLPCACLIILTYIVAKVANIHPEQLVADPNGFAKQAPYTGIVSQIGNLFWCATVTICLFCSFLISRYGEARGKHRVVLFLLFSGLLSTLLLFDDLFLLHENFDLILYGSSDMPRKMKNLAELVVFIVYGTLISGFIYKFWKTIFHSDFLFLLLAIVCFLLSTIVDMTPSSLSGHSIVEEGFKFLGIVSWLSYYFRFCIQQLSKQIAST